MKTNPQKIGAMTENTADISTVTVTSEAVNHRPDRIHGLMIGVGFAFFLCAVIHTGGAAEPLGIAMENYAYPHPVKLFPLTIDGQDLRMA